MRKYIDIITEAILKESVDFHPAVLTVEPDGRQMVDWPEGTTEAHEEPCRGCKGAGVDRDGYTCDDCFGAKVEKNTIYKCPGFNCSTANTTTACELLGVDWDYSGWIEPLMLPMIRLRLRKIIQDPSHFSKPGSDTHSIRHDQEGSVDYDNPPFGVKAPLMLDHTDSFALEGLMKAASRNDWAAFKNAKRNADDAQLTERGRRLLQAYYDEVLAHGGDSAASVEPTRGARMIGGGLPATAIKAYAERLLAIVDWAIEHKTGMSWA